MIHGVPQGHPASDGIKTISLPDDDTQPWLCLPVNGVQTEARKSIGCMLDWAG